VIDDAKRQNGSGWRRGGERGVGMLPRDREEVGGRVGCVREWGCVCEREKEREEGERERV